MNTAKKIIEVEEVNLCIDCDKPLDTKSKMILENRAMYAYVLNKTRICNECLDERRTI